MMYDTHVTERKKK